MDFLVKTTLLASALALTACNSQVADFVNGARRLPSGGTTPVTDVQSSSPMGFKITPGKIKGATNNNASIMATITPTDRKFVMGSDMSMTVTLSRSRTKPQ